MKNLFAILIVLVSLNFNIFAQDKYDAQPLEDSVAKFYLKIIYMEVFERQEAPRKYPELYYIKMIDQISGDTLFYNIYLDEAVRYLEQKTNIPAPKAKYGGIILTPDIYYNWKQAINQ